MNDILFFQDKIVITTFETIPKEFIRDVHKAVQFMLAWIQQARPPKTSFNSTHLNYFLRESLRNVARQWAHDAATAHLGLKVDDLVILNTNSDEIEYEVSIKLTRCGFGFRVRSTFKR